MKKFIDIDLEITKDLTKKMMEELTYIAKHEVVVGVPEDKSDGGTRYKWWGRDAKGQSKYIQVKSDTSLAYIASIHEFGFLSRGIPRRSFLIDTIEENRTKYADMIASRIFQTSAYRATGYKALKELAATLQNDVKLKFINNNWEPLHPKTVKEKTKHYYYKGVKGGNRTGNNPLIDTGALRQSIRGVVRKK